MYILLINVFLFFSSIQTLKLLLTLYYWNATFTKYKCTYTNHNLYVFRVHCHTPKPSHQSKHNPNLATPGHAALYIKTSSPKKSAWKKLAYPKSNLMDIVNRSRFDQQKVIKGPTKTKEEEMKMKRRKLYRLMTEEKPTIPIQQRNFYNHVMENKEVVKTLSLLSTCMQDMKQVRDRYYSL